MVGGAAVSARRGRTARRRAAQPAAGGDVSRSVLFHVQYLLGIGHLQRSLRIANALARQGIRVTLVCGGPPGAELDAEPSIQGVQLPAVRARDARFELIDGAGRPLADRLSD